LTLEKWLSEIIKSRGINLSEMARLINVPYMALYNSLMDKSRHREIKGWELVKVCIFLNVDPREFAEETAVQ
jgi:predicted transcriptional regulator